jgi:uncharacterized membrane protein YsdA (DUF1294 family)
MILDNLQFIDWLGIYLLLINIVAFMLFAVDKAKAKKRKRRISENALLFVALIGGSLGALMGMKAFKHKTKHNKFRFGLPLILLIHLGLALVIYWLINIL